MTVNQVAVVGGGLMGGDIADVAAVAGCSVVLREIDKASLDSARARIEKGLERAVRSGKADTGQQSEVLLDRIAFTTALDDLSEAEVVIEAVPEDIELKTTVLRDVAESVGPAAVIASNTSSIPIAQLAGRLPHPERVLGLHFFSPVPAMKLVEVVVALDTSPDTVERAKAFAEQIGKVSIETKDRSGFIVNMLLVPYLMARCACTRRASPIARRSTRPCSSAAGIRWDRSRCAI
jgi:3-hydroxybutyryl-CoA dehydrogenase